MQMNHSNDRKWRGTKESLKMKVEKESQKAGLKLNIKKNEEHDICSHHFMENRRLKSGSSDGFCIQIIYGHFNFYPYKIKV